MRNYSAKDVDAYIAGSNEEARPHLKELRVIIKSTIPNAEEKISWGVPFYWYHGALAGFSAFKNHVGFGFAFVLQNNERGKLLKKGYTTGKKTIQIKFDQKMPTGEIRQILKVQAKMNEAKRAINNFRRSRGQDFIRKGSNVCRNIKPLYNYEPPVTDEDSQKCGASIRAKDQRICETFERERGSIPASRERDRAGFHETPRLACDIQSSARPGRGGGQGTRPGRSPVQLARPCVESTFEA